MINVQRTTLRPTVRIAVMHKKPTSLREEISDLAAIKERRAPDKPIGDEPNASSLSIPTNLTTVSYDFSTFFLSLSAFAAACFPAPEYMYYRMVKLCGQSFQTNADQRHTGDANGRICGEPSARFRVGGVLKLS